MSGLFVSYHYTARQGDQIYQGFENMIYGKVALEPRGYEQIEEIEEECAKHCIKELGMDNAVAKVIMWKTIDGI